MSPRITPAYIFDIDGTLADITHRIHFIRNPEGKKDWVAFKHFVFADKPIKHMVDLCRTLYWASRRYYDEDGRLPWDVVLMSGRNEHQRDDTIKWLAEVACLPTMPLYMRKDEDYRADDIIKRELLSEVRADGYAPIMAFDDRDRVVAMWRANDVPCAQVAPGDF